MTVALVGAPLSEDYRLRLEASLGVTPTYVTVRGVRAMSPVRAWRTLSASVDGHLLIPVEDPDGQALVPILEVMAALSRARRIEVVLPDLRRKRISRLAALAGGIGVLWASLGAWWSLLKARSEVARLIRAARVEARTGASGRAVYIKANLAFGVRAGGSVGHVAGVANELQRRGIGVDMVAFERPAMLDANIAHLPVQPPATFALPPEVNHYQLNYRFDRLLAGRYGPADVAFVYQRMSTANWAGVRLSRRLGRPLVVEYNGSEAWIAKNWGNPLIFHELAVCCEDVNLRHAHLVVTVSETSREDLVERGVAPERIVVYPNCIDPRVFDPARYGADEIRAIRASAGLGEDATVVGFMGTFGRWHGTEVLARAIRRMLDDDPSWISEHDVAFLLVGDGARMPAVRDILGPHADSDRVRLTGLVPQETAPNYLAACDILVSPHVANEDGTRFFGSPTKLFEYMAMARAIVASDLEQIGEVMAGSYRATALPTEAIPSADEMSLGILARPGEPDDIREGIRFLVENQEWRRAVANNARNEARARYTWEAHVSTILERLEDFKSREGAHGVAV